MPRPDDPGRVVSEVGGTGTDGHGHGISGTSAAVEEINDGPRHARTTSGTQATLDE
ncbi:MAG: hypothetical protein HY791_06905 [Deltaproteobacteria bacterium]|nr:hypothetical protein [Deltaproteobacteria bacterium]